MTGCPGAPAGSDHLLAIMDDPCADGGRLRRIALGRPKRAFLLKRGGRKVRFQKLTQLATRSTSGGQSVLCAGFAGLGRCSARRPARRPGVRTRRGAVSPVPPALAYAVMRRAVGTAGSAAIRRSRSVQVRPVPPGRGSDGLSFGVLPRRVYASPSMVGVKGGGTWAGPPPFFHGQNTSTTCEWPSPPGTLGPRERQRLRGRPPSAPRSRRSRKV